MKVLVVGGGGREHALAWAMKKSPHLEELYVAPGNGGTQEIGENVAINPDDIKSLVSYAKEKRIELTVVGPEAPLVGGIVDRFKQEGLLCFGPTGLAARLEGSKVFAKQFMRKYGIPTADFEIFNDHGRAKDCLRDKDLPLVIKADGLAQGKGSYVAETLAEAEGALEEIMVEKKYGGSGDEVVIESFLEGEEVSVQAICCGKRALLLPSSQDHKRIFDGDEGPNTGGMGAYAPVPFFSNETVGDIAREVIEPTLEGMEREGSPFSGVLYAGLMLTGTGIKVLEFNVRFGDPETQAIVPLLRSDLFMVLYRAASGDLPERIDTYDGLSAATVVISSRGYPGPYEKGFEISGLESVEDERRVVFHAGTVRKEGTFFTSGGRVLSVTAWGRGLGEALARAYEGVERVRFEGACWRRDIGKRAL